jgi:hypothetical protein
MARQRKPPTAPPDDELIERTRQLYAGSLLTLCNGDAALAKKYLTDAIARQQRARSRRKPTEHDALLRLAAALRVGSDNHALWQVARMMVAGPTKRQPVTEQRRALAKQQALVRLLRRKLAGRTLAALAGAVVTETTEQQTQTRGTLRYSAKVVPVVIEDKKPG